AAPDAAAVIAPEKTLTYGELARRAAAVALALKGRAAPDELVAVAMHKGWEQIPAVLGVLAAGGAYLPVDPAQPAERLAMILEDGRVRTVLTQSAHADAVAWPDSVTVLSVDSLGEADPAVLHEPCPAAPENLAYVIYTSGSTGAPKGVMIEHKAALNTIMDINGRFHVGPDDRTMALASLSFDLSVWDVFGTLAAGAAIVLPDAAREKEPAHWLEVVERNHVTVWNTVPAMMQMLSEYRASVREGAEKGSIRLVLLSGDWLPLGLPDQIRSQFDAEVISLGGATEAAIWSILHPVGEVDPKWKSIPYGRPMLNQRFHVLNEFLQDCPDWVPGSLCIGGIGLARGYWHDEEKTARAFFTHPVTGERLYRTGDLGYFHPDGTIRIMGREDNQCKINGFRVEPGEVEHAIRGYEGVREAVVLPLREGSAEHLVAYVVPEGESGGSLAATLHEGTAERRASWEEIVGYDNQLEKISAAEVKDAAFYALSDSLYEAAMQAALCDLGFFTSVGDVHSIDEIIRHGRISPRYSKWLARAMAILVEKGLAVREGDRWRSVKLFEFRTAGDVRARFEGTGVNDFMFNTALNLADLLRERTHSAELYASSEAKGLYPTMFKSSNRLIANALKLMESEPREGLMSVLEVGAGHGGTTQGLLPALDGTKSRYVFTDISNYFLKNAQTNFAKYDFVSYQLYNLDIPPETQGLELHSFDAVVASSVLHDTRSIAKTLHGLLSLLKPGGILYIVEQTLFLKCFDLGMGIQQGFDVFEDTDLRPHNPLLSAEQWSRCLLETGFESVHVYPKLDKNFVNLDIDVLCAKAPDDLQVFDTAALEAHLAGRLPAYMIPSRYICLDALPRNRSGKVDRQALPKPGSLMQERRVYAAPQTDTQKRLAEIWSEVLNLETPGLKDNFFELGGDSLLATVLIARVHRVFSVELSVLDIYTASTLEDMARQIDAPSRGSQGQLVPIQPEGDGNPWFCLPGAEGSLMTFAEMARCMRPATPMYGFRPVGADGREKPLTRIEDMAARCIESMRAQRPEGPYNLMGFCMGGFVAYEMAAQLERQGIASRVVLVDSHLLPREVWADEVRSLVIYTGLFGVPMALIAGVDSDPQLSALNAISRDREKRLEPVTSLEEIAAMPADARPGEIFRRISAKGYLEGMTEEGFASGYAVLRANMDAMHAYNPPKRDVRVDFFRASGNPIGGPDGRAYWSAVCDTRVTDVDGTHLTIMTGEAVRKIADTIRRN
ncbi:MAG: amino acid adenylation domain-containing protein, partial [Desulfovibrionaceae bacterium]|nr:amino acid adenylation domain-containing protein [Desulfovibrionaceae bacterium]